MQTFTRYHALVATALLFEKSAAVRYMAVHSIELMTLSEHYLYSKPTCGRKALVSGYVSHPLTSSQWVRLAPLTSSLVYVLIESLSQFLGYKFRFVAMQATFILSAIFHEYLITMIYGVVFPFMLIQFSMISGKEHSLPCV